MRTLYPDIKPYVQHSLEVTPPHVLYLEESGNPGGIPVLFLHGGPGAGCEPYHRRFFHPERYRILLFDQRGAGRSTPHAEVTRNDTWALVADIETIRAHLGIDRWVVFGGSWGSTLGLAYAQTHPQRVLGLILRGVFPCRPQEIHWFYQEGASKLLPDAWEDYLAPIPEAERGDLVQAYHLRLFGDNDLERMTAAKAWSVWEARAATLHPDRNVVTHFSDAYVALSLARIENHFFVHNSFLEPDQLLRDASRLADIPGVIVHGRYDLVCPLENAWALHRAWPQAELRIIADAGHSATEPGIVDALVEATDTLSERLG